MTERYKGATPKSWQRNDLGEPVKDFEREVMRGVNERGINCKRNKGMFFPS